MKLGQKLARARALLEGIELAGESGLSDDEREEVAALSAAMEVEQRQSGAEPAGSAAPAQRRTETRDATPVAGPRAPEPGSPEAGEFRSIEGRASVAALLRSVMDGASLPADGAIRELQREHGLRGNQLPIGVLTAEARAATTAPTSVGADSHPGLPAVFPRSVVSHLRIPTPIVEQGDQVFPVMTTEAVAASADAGAEVAETDGTIEAAALTPRRFSVTFRFRIEDLARTSDEIENMLRRNASDALAAAVDDFAVNDSTAGILAVGTAPGNPSGNLTYQGFRRTLYGVLDGRYAGTLADCRVALGSKTHELAASLYVAGGEVSALESVAAAMPRVSAHMPAPATSGANKYQEGIVSRGPESFAVFPMWRGVTFIRDVYSKAKSGEVSITANMLGKFKVLRTDKGLLRVKFQTE